jgi:DNA-binding PadR family transcriptional regulator
LVVLALLEQKPMHSYGLLVELDRRFGNLYEPSTGTIYPAVSALAEETLIEQVSGNGDGRGDVYRLTAAGKAALAERSELLTRLELRTGVKVRRDTDLESMLQRFGERVRAASARVNSEFIERELIRTAGRIERSADTGDDD